MYDFVKTMYSWGINIDSYLELGTITEEEYQEITGKEGINE